MTYPLTPCTGEGSRAHFAAPLPDLLRSCPGQLARVWPLLSLLLLLAGTAPTQAVLYTPPPVIMNPAPDSGHPDLDEIYVAIGGDWDYAWVSLQRLGDNQYWLAELNQWQALHLMNRLPGTAGPYGGTGFARHRFTRLPETLDEGEYLLQLKLEYTGWTFLGISPRRRDDYARFYVDRTQPELVEITSHRNGGRYGSLSRLWGDAWDNEGGTGIEHVLIRLRHGSQYWDGTNWVSHLAQELEAQLGEGWSLTNNLPSREQLEPGDTYEIRATAVDLAGNFVQSTIEVIMDRQPPVLEVSQPRPNQTLRSLMAIRGRVSDDEGIATLQMALQRRADGRYWSPLDQQWLTRATVLRLPVELVGGQPPTQVDWSRTQSLPTTAQFQDGEHLVILSTTDRFGYSNTVSSPFRVDTRLPEGGEIQLTRTNLGGNLLGLSGMLLGGGSNLLGAPTLLMQRSSDDKYWDGTRWTDTPVALEARRTLNGWEPAKRLPSQGDLPDGGYRLGMQKRGPLGSSTNLPMQDFVVDNTPPTLALLTPVSGSSYLEPIVATGHAADNPGGSGLVRVGLLLGRNSGGAPEFWNWTASTWTTNRADVAEQPATLSGTNWSLALPVLSPGSYLLGVNAVDQADNPTALSCNFMVGNPAGPDIGITSPTNGATPDLPPLVQGFASDPTGVTYVNVRLRRDAGETPEYWDWIDGQFAAEVEYARMWVFPTGTTSWTLVLPALPYGRYAIEAKANNTGGFSSFVVQNEFNVVDRIAPRLEILTPSPGASVPALPEMTGWASDNSGAVDVSAGLLRFRSTGQPDYWNFSNQVWTAIWTPLETEVPLSLSGTNWTLGLPPLHQGHFAVFARAIDAAGNQAGYWTREFQIPDTNGPVVTVSDLGPGSKVNRLNPLAGSITDNPGGSGASHVAVMIYQFADDRYWNGTGWIETPTYLRAQTTGERWEFDRGPSFADLTNGQYSITALGYDHAARNTMNYFLVEVDKQMPTDLGISSPSHLAQLRSLPEIRGFIADNPGGSGPAKVEVYLQRTNDALWWNGSAWGDIQTALPATLSGGDWVLTNQLPSPAALSNGAIAIHALGFDVADNRIGVSVLTLVDTVPPETVTVLVPPAGTIQSNLTAFTVLAQDDPQGGGIAQVEGWIKRMGDDTYWNGSGWNEPATLLPMAFADGFWNLAANLPSGTNLLDGTYEIGATAADLAGNTNAASILVLVRTTDTGLRIRSVARVEGNKFSLSFSGLPNASYRLEMSENLLHWTNYIPLTAGPDGLFQHSDTGVSDQPHRFYRLAEDHPSPP